MAEVKLGQHVYTIGESKVGKLRDSTDVRNDFPTLRQHLEEDGYVFLRGVLPKEVVAQGRDVVLRHLQSQGLIDPCSSLEEALVCGTHNGDQGRVKGTNDIIRTEAFLSVVEHPALFELFDGFFNAPSCTFDFKWLRAVQPGESSGFHMDSVYMYRGSPNLLTCWVPLCEVPWKLGGLTVLQGSHRSDGFQQIRETYGELDLDRDDVGGTGWFTEDPEEALHFGGQFQTAEFHPGDVVFFTMKTLHGSSVNMTNRWRLSVDIRFQPKADKIDTRWLVDAKTGEVPGVASRWVLHRDDKTIFPKTMEDAKHEWGVHWKDADAAQGKRRRVD